MGTENSTNDRKKNNIIFIGIIAFLSALILCLILIIAHGGKKDDGLSDKNTTGEDIIASGNDADENTADKDNTPEKEENTGNSESQKPDCYVTITGGNSWENSGKFCGQLDAAITNNSDAEIKNWSVQIPVSDGTSVDSSWNGNFTVSNGILTIKPVEYNETVAKKSTLKDIGFIVSVNSKKDFDAMIKGAILLVDGKEYTYVADSQKEEAATTEESTDNATTEEKNGTDNTQSSKPAETEKGTPFDNHGKLKVAGTDIVDKNGNKYQLKGVSTHGIAWFPDYVNKDALKTFRDDWGANLVRIAMYTDENGGYCTDGNKDNLKKLVDKGVNAATELGMYVIVDWHVLHDLTPMKYKDEAKTFFQEMSAQYKDYDNVIYEICNEPNGGTDWSEVKAYAEEIIPVIRANDPDALIIVGTPNWSQDVDIASNDPIKGDNILYAIHFYAATHTDGIRNKVVTAIDNGLPVFVSEFSICDASGNGAIDYNQADKWFELIDKYNLSYAAWNVSNKAETSSLILSSCSKTSGWAESDLSDAGKYIRKKINGID